MKNLIFKHNNIIANHIKKNNNITLYLLPAVKKKSVLNKFMLNYTQFKKLHALYYMIL